MLVGILMPTVFEGRFLNANENAVEIICLSTWESRFSGIVYLVLDLSNGRSMASIAVIRGL
jgi:hypothetical protein